MTINVLDLFHIFLIDMLQIWSKGLSIEHKFVPSHIFYVLVKSTQHKAYYVSLNRAQFHVSSCPCLSSKFAIALKGIIQSVENPRKACHRVTDASFTYFKMRFSFQDVILISRVRASASMTVN